MYHHDPEIPNSVQTASLMTYEIFGYQCSIDSKSSVVERFALFSGVYCFLRFFRYWKCSKTFVYGCLFNRSEIGHRLYIGSGVQNWKVSNSFRKNCEKLVKRKLVIFDVFRMFFKIIFKYYNTRAVISSFAGKSIVFPLQWFLSCIKNTSHNLTRMNLNIIYLIYNQKNICLLLLYLFYYLPSHWKIQSSG